MEEFLKRIAVEGNDDRFNAICEILDELKAKYFVQKTETTYSVPIYEEMDESQFHQMNIFDYFGEFSDDDLDEEYEIVMELAMDFDINLDCDLDEIDYEVLKEAASDCDIDLPSFEEFKEKYCSNNSLSHWRFPEIIGYEERVSITKNIIISLKDFCSNPNAEKIVFTAHYDAVRGSTGANDNGSGVVILLAFIREIMNLGSTDKWFEIVFEDREETGGTGAKNYIQEFGEEIGEVINLDTCGVGDNVIITNKSNHPVKGTSILINQDIIEEHNVLIYPRLPYCDSDVFLNNGYQVTTICTLPTKKENELSEKDFSDELSKKDSLLSPFRLFSKRKEYDGICEVYKYMHNGERDSIEWIRFDTMKKILDYISLLI